MAFQSHLVSFCFLIVSTTTTNLVAQVEFQELGKGVVSIEEDEVILAWRKPIFVHVFQAKRKEVSMLGVSPLELAKFNHLLDEYTEKQRTALIDIEKSRKLGKEDSKQFRSAFSAEARLTRTQAENDIAGWVRDTLNKDQRLKIVEMIVRTLGNASLTTALVREHLDLTSEQGKALEVLEVKERRFLKKMFRDNLGKGPIKPTDAVNDTFASFSAQLYQILDQKQIEEYLRLSGSISEDEGILEFLQRMPKQIRSQLLEKSNRMFEVWLHRPKGQDQPNR